MLWCRLSVYWIDGVGGYGKTYMPHSDTRSKSECDSNTHTHTNPHPKQYGNRASVQETPLNFLWRGSNKSPTKIHSLAFFSFGSFFFFFILRSFFRFVIGDHLKRWSIACLSVFFSESSLIFCPMPFNTDTHTTAISNPIQPHPFYFIFSLICTFVLAAISHTPLSFGATTKTHTHIRRNTHTTAVLKEDFRFMLTHRVMAHKASKRTQRRQLISFLPWQTSARWINYVHIFHFPPIIIARPYVRHHYPFQIQIMVYERSGEKIVVFISNRA